MLARKVSWGEEGGGETSVRKRVCTCSSALLWLLCRVVSRFSGSGTRLGCLPGGVRRSTKEEGLGCDENVKNVKGCGNERKAVRLPGVMCLTSFY